jgi:hypothetical protein
MSIHFAAAHVLPPLRIDAQVRARLARLAANDNRHKTPGDEMLHAALRHFGSHGLGAALQAALQTERAWSTDDRASFLWWLDICRILDRRMADHLEQRLQWPRDLQVTV